MICSIRKYTALVLVVSMFALAACGDDSEENSQNNVNANNTNNASVNNSNNSNNANNTDTNNSNNVNNTDTNNSNNAGGTNNTNNGTNQSGDLTCTQILQCILGCQTEDMACTDQCRTQGTVEAQQQIDAYLGCVDENCPMDLGISELNECIEMNCAVEQDTCLGL